LGKGYNSPNLAKSGGCIFKKLLANFMVAFDYIAFSSLTNHIGYLSGEEDDPGDMKSASIPAVKRNVMLRGLLNSSKEHFKRSWTCLESMKSSE
jgi:hypothetical protein